MTIEKLFQFEELCEGIIAEKEASRHPELMRRLDEMEKDLALSHVAGSDSSRVLRLGDQFKIVLHGPYVSVHEVQRADEVN